MAGEGWSGFAKALMTGPTWIWTAVLVATGLRLFFGDTAVAAKLSLNSANSAAWVNPLVGGAFVMSLSFVAFRFVETAKPSLAARRRRARDKRRDQKISEQFAAMPEAARAIIAETIFTGESSVQIFDNDAHVAAVRLQQCGAGFISQGVLGAEFHVSRTWLDFARRHAIADERAD